MLTDAERRRITEQTGGEMMVQRYNLYHEASVQEDDNGFLVKHGDYTALESILRRIINDLPTNRDWLDPELEKAAMDILKGVK